MPINALPDDTIRTIGSGQVLTDPVSVVKELTDNALDARATAIFVEISANALETIQAKDNGYGIAPVDRALVCKRYCTSKITCCEDIARIGGGSLGFRGEALASAAEMSGSLVLTTRIEGEATAVSLKVGRQGNVESEERASHPVGTTVRVGDYLKNLPVRRQTASKAPGKALSGIKRTLQAYALARPAVRFSLRILKAKNDKGNFTYAPKIGASVLDAAVKVVGKPVVDQCRWKVWKPLGRSDGSEAPNLGTNLDDTTTIEALLARPDCDVSSITKAGQYLSIDSRPVSSSRGTLKQIVSLYKSYLRSSCSVGNGDKIIDPFLYMNIICPIGSYDANIEPAKDDVLFVNAVDFLGIVESFYRDTYGELPAPSRAQEDSRAGKAQLRGFDLLLARKEQYAADASPASSNPSAVGQRSSGEQDEVLLESSAPPSISQAVESSGRTLDHENASSSLDDGYVQGRSEEPSPTNSSSSSPMKVWAASNMYAADENDETDLFIAQDHHGKPFDIPDPEEEAGLRDVTVSNPWSIAKVNASVRPRNTSGSMQQLLTPASQVDPSEISSVGSPPVARNTQLSSRLSPTPRLSRRTSSDTSAPSSSPERFPYPLAARGSRSGEYALESHKAANKERYGGGALDTWVQKSINGNHDSPSSAVHDEESVTIDPETGNTRRRDFISARQLPTGTPLSEIRTAPTRQRRQSPKKQPGTGINKPFTSPLTDDRVWFDIGPQKHKPKPPSSDRTQSTLTPNGTLHFASNDIDPISSSSSSPERPVHPDLAQALDYENRKALATQQHRANLLRQKRAELEAEKNFIDRRPASSSPHKNRYNKAVAALHEAGDEGSADIAASPVQALAFEAGDPRQYWLRVQERERVADAAGKKEVSEMGEVVVKRRKTGMLPLERVREEWSVRDLVLPIRGLDAGGLAAGFESMRKGDEYASSGNVVPGFDDALSGDTVREWERQVSGLIYKKFRRGDPALGTLGAPALLKIELWAVMQEHLAQYADEDEGEEARETT